MQSSYTYVLKVHKKLKRILKEKNRTKTCGKKKKKTKRYEKKKKRRKPWKKTKKKKRNRELPALPSPRATHVLDTRERGRATDRF